VRGASALQAVLDDLQEKGLRVIVVWEPVLITDLAPPMNSVLSIISDPRAVQFYDEYRVLSGELLRATTERGEACEDDIVWDYVFVFSPEARWEMSPPIADFAGGPVVTVLDQVRQRLTLLTGSSISTGREDHE